MIEALNSIPSGGQKDKVLWRKPGFYPCRKCHSHLTHKGELQPLRRSLSSSWLQFLPCPQLVFDVPKASWFLLSAARALCTSPWTGRSFHFTLSIPGLFVFLICATVSSPDLSLSLSSWHWPPSKGTKGWIVNGE